MVCPMVAAIRHPALAHTHIPREIAAGSTKDESGLACRASWGSCCGPLSQAPQLCVPLFVPELAADGGRPAGGLASVVTSMLPPGSTTAALVPPTTASVAVLSREREAAVEREFMSPTAADFYLKVRCCSVSAPKGSAVPARRLGNGVCKIFSADIETMESRRISGRGGEA